MAKRSNKLVWRGIMNILLVARTTGDLMVRMESGFDSDDPVETYRDQSMAWMKSLCDRVVKCGGKDLLIHTLRMKERAVDYENNAYQSHSDVWGEFALNSFMRSKERIPALDGDINEWSSRGIERYNETVILKELLDYVTNR